VAWLQEEPENMGAWMFVRDRLAELVGDDFRLMKATRPESGSPAAGSLAVHQQEQEELLAQVLADL